MKIDSSTWKTFYTDKLFKKLENGKANQQMLVEGDECFYIGAKRNDNGVMMHCMKDESLIQKGKCIIFICNGQGSVGFANYMDRDFIGTTDIVAGYNDNLNKYNGLFLATIYSQERPKYSFGRKWKTHLKNTQICLPIKMTSKGDAVIDETHEYSPEGFIPDWEWMENYIKSLHHKPVETKNKAGQVPELKVAEWKFFLLNEICNLTMGNKMDWNDMSTDEPTVNFVGRSAENNGVAGRVDIVYDKYGAKVEPYKAGCITIALGGSLGSTYLQHEPFYTSQNVSVMEFGDEVSNYAKLFLCTLIHNESLYKYFPFGRELNTHIKTDFGFTLPVDTKGNPDWQFMEDYIKALPYGDRLEK